MQNEDGERVSCNVNVESKPSVYTISNLIINGSEISADILKNQDRKVKDYIFVSLYDQKGRRTGSSYTQLYFQAGKTTQFADLLECGNASTVKIFIWEGLSSLRPLSNVATAAIPQNGELSFSLTARCLENRE